MLNMFEGRISLALYPTIRTTVHSSLAMNMKAQGEPSAPFPRQTRREGAVRAYCHEQLSMRRSCCTDMHANSHNTAAHLLSWPLHH